MRRIVVVLAARKLAVTKRIRPTNAVSSRGKVGGDCPLLKYEFKIRFLELYEVRMKTDKPMIAMKDPIISRFNKFKVVNRSSYTPNFTIS